jgi:ubiquinone/menaquinone biosynthesis C-methylase UbiE
MKEKRTSSSNLAATQAKYAYRNPLLRYANQRYFETVHTMLEGLSYRSLLDVGTGEGVILDQVAGSCRIPVGMDLDHDRIHEAHARVPSQPLLVGNAQALPFDNHSFDLVLMLEILEHAGKPQEALTEAWRVSRRYLLASVPNEPWWRLGNLVRLKYLHRLGNTPEHINHWSSRGFRAFVSGHFTVIKVATPVLWTFILAERKG